MIEIDGTEGGGQMLRTALALSALTNKPFKAFNIRKSRPKAGLKAQHINCFKALEMLCNAKYNDVYLGSESIEFYPGKITGKAIDVDIGTAGSISLLLQAALLPALFASKNVKFSLTGGTCGKWQMPIEYMQNVFVPQLRRFGDIEVKLLKRGYYPKGNGRAEINVKPKLKIDGYGGFNEFYSALSVVNRYNLIEQGKLIQIKGVSHASKDLEKANVAERQAEGAKRLLNKLNVPININVEYSDALSAGSGICLFAIFGRDSETDFDNPIILGSDALGEPGKKAELVGEEAGNTLLNEIKNKSCVDKHLSDNLLPFMALLPGSIIKASEISNHCRTNMSVIEKFLDVKFEVDEENHIISVNKK